jgi:hypothetical protein
MRKNWKVAIAVVIATTAIGGGALAFWTQGGTGDGTASTGTTSNITVIQDSTVAGLYPGGPAGNLSGHFNNPGAGAVRVSGVLAEVDAFSSQGDVNKPACTAADFAIGGTTGPYVVQPGAATTWSGLTISLVNGAGNQDNCKSVTPALSYTANA